MTPSLQDILAGLAARLDAGPRLAQLPLKELQAYLETEWQPDGGLLLQPASIGADLLEPASVGANALDPAALVLRGNRGASTVTFTASGTSAVRTITHGLGSAPASVQVGGNAQTQALFWQAFNKTATTFDVQCFLATGTVSATFGFDWAAIL